MNFWLKLCLYKWRLYRRDPSLCRAIKLNHRRRRDQIAKAAQREAHRQFRMRLREKRSDKYDLPPYLSKNSWEHELNYKLWITKGARFTAARRCEDMDSCGLWSATILSAYLIIVGLIPYFPHPAFNDISSELLGFGTTALSIILLATTLLVSVRQYPLQAKAYHECSLRIGILYDRLRQAKELSNDEEKRKEIADITCNYENILPNYPNHQPIDRDIFQTLKPDYFRLKWWQILWRRISYYFRTRGMLDFVIAAGPVSVLLFVLKSK